MTMMVPTLRKPRPSTSTGSGLLPVAGSSDCVGVGAVLSVGGFTFGADVTDDDVLATVVVEAEVDVGAPVVGATDVLDAGAVVVACSVVVTCCVDGGVDVVDGGTVVVGTEVVAGTDDVVVVGAEVVVVTCKVVEEP